MPDSDGRIKPLRLSPEDEQWLQDFNNFLDEGRELLSQLLVGHVDLDSKGDVAMNTDQRQRLFEEYQQLQDRIEKLKNFKQTDEYAELPPVERNDLREQLAHMRLYAAVLSRRVSRQAHTP